MMMRYRRVRAFLVRRRSPIRWFYVGGRNMLQIALPFGRQILLYIGR